MVISLQIGELSRTQGYKDTEFSAGVSMDQGSVISHFLSCPQRKDEAGERGWVVGGRTTGLINDPITDPTCLSPAQNVQYLRRTEARPTACGDVPGVQVAQPGVGRLCV